MTSDKKTHRPLVGYAIFNEASMAFDDGKLQVHVSTFVHEVLHALYFHPKAFEHFPVNSSGQKFLVEEPPGKGFLQGDALVREARRHFGCGLLERGKTPRPSPSNKQCLWKTRAGRVRSARISKSRLAEMK